MEPCVRGKGNQGGRWGCPPEITLGKHYSGKMTHRLQRMPWRGCSSWRFLLHLFPSNHYCIFLSLFFFSLLLFSPLFSLLFYFIFFFSEITFTTSIGGCYILWSLQINLCARNFSQHFYVTLLYLTELNETEKGNISHLLEFYSLLLLIEICKLIYTNINCIILSFQKSIREVNWWFSSL